MQKSSLIVHHKYLDDVIKRFHETGLMEFIDISKEEQETSSDAENEQPITAVKKERRSFLDKLTERVKEFLDNAE